MPASAGSIQPAGRASVPAATQSFLADRRSPLHPLNRLLSVFRLRPMRKNFQITLILFARLIRLIELFQTHSQPERRDRVIVFVKQRLAITILAPMVLLPLEI